ncbi:MAG: hypothetical protein HAW58_03370, partial [Candidatus Thioglobus sp.]|nr:hypothetical protein [Candidatus Thioglobus sp.]
LLIAKKHQVEMPICTQVLQVTEGKISPIEAVNYLLSRDLVSGCRQKADCARLRAD